MEVAYNWRKSSYSGSEGGNCLEVAYHWHKSTHSSDQGGNCVEVAAHPTAVHILPRRCRRPVAPAGRVRRWPYGRRG